MIIRIGSILVDVPSSIPAHERETWAKAWLEGKVREPTNFGLGDVVAGAAKAVGVKPSPGCGCEKRREALNRATPKVVARLLDALRGYWSKW
jgi:hypothetical protein